MRQLFLLIVFGFVSACQPAVDSMSGVNEDEIQDSSLADHELDDSTDEFPVSAKDSLVREFVNCFAPLDIDKIVHKVAYPLDRQHPLPDILNEQGLRARFHEVFDDSLVRMITSADINRDWVYMGDDGVMLFRGELWLNVLGQCQVLNYSGQSEQKKRLRLIDAERSTLHPSLRKFIEPVHLIHTADKHVRIDKVGEETYRYAEWNPGVSMDKKPDLVLEDGRCEFDGSGGNVNYRFMHGGFTYICFINNMVSGDDAPGVLFINEGEREVSSLVFKRLVY